MASEGKAWLDFVGSPMSGSDHLSSVIEPLGTGALLLPRLLSRDALQTF